MTLVVPYVGELLDSDLRLVRLAEFFAVPYETLALAGAADPTAFLSAAVPEGCSCFIINPRVIQQWLGPGGLPAALVKFLLSRFPHMLVHGVRAGAFDSEIVAALSHDGLKSVEAIDDRSDYSVTADSAQICGAFSGLSFGPANPANDHVFYATGDPSVRELISIGRRPFMAAAHLETTEVLFIASEDVADLDAEVGDASHAEFFSRLVPYAMALRYIAGGECWRPAKAQASIIIDDPLLPKRYGFLNFESLLHLAKEHNFHATIGFIPHNFRRNSARITRMFRKNAAHLSICYHGNDHVDSEFASRDVALLNTLLRVAEERMDLHHQTSGLPCDRVMIFPQGSFSIEAMRALKSHNFYAAVNTIPHPADQPVRLTLGELAQPAILRFEGFPLFIRKPIRHTGDLDIAFNAFFGRPVLIVEHHDIFQHPDSLIEIAGRINSISPAITWASLANVVGNSALTRRTADGTYHVRAYSSAIEISNPSSSLRSYSIEWERGCHNVPIERVVRDGATFEGFATEGGSLRVSVEIAPGATHTFSVVHRNDHASVSSLGWRWTLEAFLRRRLSELRDNYLSKNRRLFAAGKAFHQRFLKG